MKEIEELIKLAEYNHSLDLQRGEKNYLSLEWALDQIKAEVDEVKAELKPHNIPYIEDELSDILWSFFMGIEKFRYEGYEVSVQRVIKRALKKYQERVLPLKGNKEQDKIIWQRVKKQQKEALQKEKKILNS